MRLELPSSPRPAGRTKHDVLNQRACDRSLLGRMGSHPGAMLTRPASPPPVKSKLSVVVNVTLSGAPVVKPATTATCQLFSSGRNTRGAHVDGGISYTPLSDSTWRRSPAA